MSSPYPVITDFNPTVFSRYEQIAVLKDVMQDVIAGRIHSDRLNIWPWRLMAQSNVDKLHGGSDHISVQMHGVGGSSHKLHQHTAIMIGHTLYLMFLHRSADVPGVMVRPIPEGQMSFRLSPELISCDEVLVHVHYAMTGEVFMPAIGCHTEDILKVGDICAAIRNHMLAGGHSAFTKINLFFHSSRTPLGPLKVIWKPGYDRPAGSYGPLRRFLFKQPRVKTLEYYFLQMME